MSTTPFTSTTSIYRHALEQWSWDIDTYGREPFKLVIFSIWTLCAIYPLKAALNCMNITDGLLHNCRDISLPAFYGPPMRICYQHWYIFILAPGAIKSTQIYMGLKTWLRKNKVISCVQCNLLILKRLDAPPAYKAPFSSVQELSQIFIKISTATVDPQLERYSTWSVLRDIGV